MLTVETKRHIDAARQVLVGVVPNPTSQIDQITNALIYKFMDDMDQSGIKAGGEPVFFVGDLERYAWTRLMDTRLGNQERMNLYEEALIKFSQAKQLPDLFRSIFKSAYLPYRSPETLGLFLKEIAYFDYSHPEELGNAYEYLLSIMSSQGDAGQFRTPRHIIDFIVDVVNPTKDDKVLDPACGTAGFLVSAYNHILEQHDGKDDPEKEERPLTPDEKRKLANNFEGYDIDPGMVRIAQVNMYLHQFKNPQIFQYNSLANEDRWGDKFDVILANPPFMSPKGGMTKSNKFSIDSTRSEVLFIDYIMNHLRPKGRAGIIVPEGIIFQSGKSHKELRKNLLEDGLYAVVSLPGGVFQPYSGVKTSILLFDNDLAKKSEKILFVKITHDGYDLGAQRRESKKNDLPKAIDVLKKFKENPNTSLEELWGDFAWGAGTYTSKDFIIAVSRKTILESEDYNLSGDHYHVTTDYSNAKWPMVELGAIVEILDSKRRPITKSDRIVGQFPYYGATGILDYVQGYIFDERLVLIGEDGAKWDIGDKTAFIAEGKYWVNNHAHVVRPIKEKLIDTFLVSYLNSIDLSPFITGVTVPKLNQEKLKSIKIPLPPLEIQEQIVAELDGYQNIINGARQIVQNWKPKININPEWEKVKLGEVADFENGDRGVNYPSKLNRVENGIPFINAGHLTDYGIDMKNMDYISRERFDLLGGGKVQVGDILLCLRGSLGKFSKVENISEGAIASSLVIVRPKKEIMTDFLLVYFGSSFFSNMIFESKNGVAQPNLAAGSVKGFEIPLPSIAIQKQIVEKIEVERALVESAKKLIEIYEQKTKDVIAKLWEE